MSRTNVFTILRKVSPMGVLLCTASVGAVLLVTSIACGVSSYLYFDEIHQVASQRGYLSSVNWSVGITIAMAASFFFMLSALQDVDGLGRQLYDAGMLVRADFTQPGEGGDSFKREWLRLLRQNSRWVLVLAGIGAVASIVEWWVVSGGPLLIGAEIREQEYDWCTKFVSSDVTLKRVLNAAFCFVVFLTQIVYICALAVYFVFITLFSKIIYSLSSSNTAHRIIPNLGSPDRRKGFEVFESVSENILLAAASSYALFYLSRLWNVYIRSGSPNLWAFVVGDLVRGFRKADWATSVDRLFDIGAFSYSSTMVTLGAVVALTLSIIVVVRVLRMAALQAKRDLHRHLTEQGRTAELSEVESMSVWPMSYPRPNHLLVLAVFAVIGIIFFRIGIVYLGALIAWVTNRMFQSLKSA